MLKAWKNMCIQISLGEAKSSPFSFVKITFSLIGHFQNVKNTGIENTKIELFL